MLSFLFRKSATTKGLTLYRKENRRGTKIAFEEKDEFFMRSNMINENPFVTVWRISVSYFVQIFGNLLLNRTFVSSTEKGRTHNVSGSCQNYQNGAVSNQLTDSKGVC
jgi:hypothetical protein